MRCPRKTLAIKHSPPKVFFWEGCKLSPIVLFMSRWLPIGLVLFAFVVSTLSSCSPTPYQEPSAKRTKNRGNHGKEHRTARCESFLPFLSDASKKYDLDLALLVGIIRVESHFNANARSRVGARGLMQVMPSTGKGLGCTRLYDPASNIDCGAKVLRKFLNRYDENWVYGLAAYNGGYALASKPHRESHAPKNFRYVEKVLEARGRYLRGGCQSVVQ